MNGVPSIEPSPYIEHGHYFDYYFTIKNPPGTYIYNSYVNLVFKIMLAYRQPLRNQNSNFLRSMENAILSPNSYP